MRLPALASISFALLTASAQAQVAYDSPKGRVEVLGLHRWTLAMLRDSIKHYVPGQDLHDAACMVTLKDSLHFAEADVTHFMMRPGETFLSIKVIEPEDAPRVKWNRLPAMTFDTLIPDYAPLILPLADSLGSFNRGRVLNWVQYADTAAASQMLAHAPKNARQDADRWYAFTNQHRSERDFALARRILRTNGFWANRMVAAALLVNASGNDSTWWALAHAMRDPHDGVREAAGYALTNLAKRSVDWRPAAEDLHLLLGGTNLPYMQRVAEVLAQTKVDPSLAPVLLHGNSAWMLDLLGAETPMASDQVHALLVQLNGGKDLGPARPAWTKWMAALN